MRDSEVQLIYNNDDVDPVISYPHILETLLAIQYHIL